MKRRRILIAVTVLVFGLLVFLVIYDYNEPTTHLFNPDGFYVGNRDPSLTAEAMYSMMNQGLSPGSGNCWSQMRMADEPRKDENGNDSDEQKVLLQMAGNFYWIAPSKVDSYDDIANDISDDNILTPYKEKDIIIAPCSLTFLNTNLKLNSAGEPYIEAITSNGYVIRWDNIDCWWCHEGKDTKKHTKTYGSKSIYEKCVGGSVIGVATANTVVTLHAVNDGEVDYSSNLPFNNLFWNS